MALQTSSPPNRSACNPPCDRCPLQYASGESFQVVLNRLIKKSGFSAGWIAKRSHTDAGNLSKYRNGIRRNPEQDTVELLCITLFTSPEIELYELDQLLMSAGYAPRYAIRDAR